MAFCPNCGTQTAEGAACPKCADATPSSGVTATGGGLTDNMAGALAYVTIIPAIVFLFAVAWTVLWIALSFVVHIPFLGWATILLWPLISLAGLIIWVILVLKAYQGQTFKLPVIGDMAEKQANTV